HERAVAQRPAAQRQGARDRDGAHAAAADPVRRPRDEGRRPRRDAGGPVAMMRVIRKNLRPALAILGLAAIAAAVAFYVLDNQRLRFPWDPAPTRMYVEFDNAQAVTPGQGQTVQVAGVEIGDIAAVELEEGRAIV